MDGHKEEDRWQCADDGKHRARHAVASILVRGVRGHDKVKAEERDEARDEAKEEANGGESSAVVVAGRDLWRHACVRHRGTREGSVETKIEETVVDKLGAVAGEVGRLPYESVTQAKRERSSEDPRPTPTPPRAGTI